MSLQLLFSLCVAFYVAALPTSAFAAVHITEIMYDAAGSDSGHEWIEISADSAINISGYKLSEGGTNHALSVVSGTTTLAAGEVAILANNADTFKTDFPNYGGTLFKSSFSLSNDGETVVLKDAKLVSVDSVSYTLLMGAAGDGNSLHSSGSVWVAGAPNPGSLAATVAIVPPPAAQKTSAAKSSKSSNGSKTSTKSTIPSTSGVSQSAAVGEIAQDPEVSSSAPTTTTILWTSVAGLAALIVISIIGVMYARAATPKVTATETALTADSFEIEE